MAKKKKINILQIGRKNWLPELTLESNVVWEFIEPENIKNFYFEEIEKLEKTNRKLKEEKKFLKPLRQFNCVIVEDPETCLDIVEMDKMIDVYKLVYAEDRNIPENLQQFYFKKQAKAMNFENKEQLVKYIARAFFNGQMGTKLDLSHFSFSQNKNLAINYEGNSYVHVEGDFGEDFVQLGAWKYNIGNDGNYAFELWPEYVKLDNNVELKYVLEYIESGSLYNIIETEEYFEKDLTKPILIDKQYKSYMCISVYAKGIGAVKISSVHYRHSHLDEGSMLIGGRRFADKNRQEFIYYFNPGDLKPPLNVYFSGYRTAEGFEGYWILNTLGAPFILIGDPRLEGGAFYMGSDEFEQKIYDVIDEHLELLGFDHSQLVLSGLSMGTFGALYHGSKFSPHAIIAGKPLVNIGDVAHNTKLLRPQEFGASIDLMRMITGGIAPENVEKLNVKFWNSFNNCDLSNTTLAISYMIHDDYDSKAYFDILKNLKNSRAKVISKGIIGRHNDNSPAINEWFMNQYTNIMRRDFDRSYENDV